jgi:hypothetical protein
MRIGSLRDENDKGYDVTHDTDEDSLIEKMKENVNEYILPHFGQTLSKDVLVDLLEPRT